MEHEFVRVEREDHVVTVTLDRPGTKNACSMSMWMAIRDTVRDSVTFATPVCAGLCAETHKAAHAGDGSKLDQIWRRTARAWLLRRAYLGRAATTTPDLRTSASQQFER